MHKPFNWLKAVFAFVALSSIFSLVFILPNGTKSTISLSSHSLSKEYVWYCRPTQNNAQPLPTEKANFLLEYPVIYIGSPSEKIIYLTFDDDAENDKIERILDLLQKHKAVAAFFLNEEYIRKNPKTIRRMTLEGNLVCNHTDRHIRISAIKDFNRFKEELIGSEDAYREATGMEMPKFFRPPNGFFSELTLNFAQKMGYTTVFWSYCYLDWQENKQPIPSKALKAILSKTHNGEIILLHTQSKTNVEILDELLTSWERMGYRFLSLDSILKKSKSDVPSA